MSVVTLERLPELSYRVVYGEQVVNPNKCTPNIPTPTPTAESDQNTEAVPTEAVPTEAVPTEAVPEVVTKHWLVKPSSEDLELVLLRLKVENHTATSAIVNIDSQAAELRDFLRRTYRPINVNDRFEEVSAPENPGRERSIVFLWNQTFEDGTSKAFELKKDCGLDGWMVFEAPKDNKFRELRWRAGDSLTITF